MSKCGKVKNPCKICLGPVTQKTGLQCQGACESWVHYSCLNYTPGKIRDIKAGVIKVTCPCPDCKTTLPKEYRTDQPFSCNNNQCPANLPPKCNNVKCPSNIGSPDKMNQTSAFKTPPCPLVKCGNECKQYSSPQMPNATPSQFLTPCTPQPQPELQGLAPCNTPNMPPSSSSDACFDKKGCDSGCVSSDDAPGDMQRNIDLGLPSLSAVEQMCNTVGQLTNQINGLMSKMKQVVKEKGGASGGGSGGGCCGKPHKNCSQKGPKSSCPKPCYCPGNPGRRK